MVLVVHLVLESYAGGLFLFLLFRELVRIAGAVVREFLLDDAEVRPAVGYHGL